MVKILRSLTLPLDDTREGTLPLDDREEGHCLSPFPVIKIT
ncbi:MAG: hypothetical protein WAO23_03065 [Dethiobacteria bacterium]